MSLDDLARLLAQTEVEAYRRRLGNIRCSDIMSRDLATAKYGTAPQDAWALLRRRHIKALPVIDSEQRLAGIITQSDLVAALCRTG